MMSKADQKIDRHQMRAMFDVSMKNDWRGATNPFSGTTTKKSKIPGIVIIMAMNFIMSIFLGAIFIPVSGLFTGMVLAATGGMIVIAIQVLLEFGNIIISPDDYHVITPHPVNSKTFYTAKLVHLLFYVSLLSASISFAPAIFAAFASKSFWAAPTVLIHFWITNVFAAVTVMNLYTLVLKKIDRQRLERLLGYIHMFLMIGFYLGLNVLTRVMRKVLVGFDIEALPWLKALPSYWFAGWVKLIIEGWDWQTFGLTILGLMVLFGLSRMAFSYLSLTYAESLTSAAWTKTSKTRRQPPKILKNLWYRVTGFEERALLMLVRANFKHDTQFRLGILGFAPLLLLYMVYGFVIGGSNVRDPLNPLPDTQVMTNVLLGMAVVILPGMMLSIMHYSKSWEASWIFYTASFDRTKMICAVDRIILWIIVIPIGILICAIFTFLYVNPLHSIMHSIFMVMVAVTGLTFQNIFSIRLPFSTGKQHGNQMSSMIGPMLGGALLFGAPIGIIAYVGYGGYIGWAICMVLMIAINWALGRGRIHRIRKVASTWEFTG